MEPEERTLTAAELEIMQVIWASPGGASVHEVHAALGDDRAYTTVATILKILEQKGFVTSAKQGRRFVFSATLQRPSYEAFSLRSIVQRLFGGEPAALVRRLIQSEPLSDTERQDLRRLLDERTPNDDSDRP